MVLASVTSFLPRPTCISVKMMSFWSYAPAPAENSVHRIETCSFHATAPPTAVFAFVTPWFASFAPRFHTRRTHAPSGRSDAPLNVMW